MPEKILKNCKVLDVENQKVLEGRSILIDGFQIKEIRKVEEGLEQEKKLPRESVFDIQDRLVMPGLIDAHVHLCVLQAASETDTLLENLKASETLKVLHGARNAKETLLSGFTTVRDMGQGDNLALRDAIERGVVPGPRIVACGWLGMTSGHQERMHSEWRFRIRPRQTDAGVDGPWEIRKKIRKLVGQGFDCIKTFTSGSGVIQHPFYPYWLEGRNFTQGELEALVDEAHAAGRRVAAHALASPAGVKLAIAAGIDTLEHGVFLDEEDAARMAKDRIFYVPTMAVVKAMWDVKELEKIKYLQIESERARGYLEAHAESFRRAQAHGVKIVMGSDTFRVLKHGENACELETMVKAGMPEMEAIISATQTASEALGIEHLTGSVEEGKWADLLVVEPSPLSNISVLRERKNLKLIMKNGEIISCQL
jgi:imidazolonepropionase-like amidohydrolase